MKLPRQQSLLRRTQSAKIHTVMQNRYSSPLGAQFDGHSAQFRVWQEARLAQPRPPTEPFSLCVSLSADIQSPISTLHAMCSQVRRVGYALYQLDSPRINPGINSNINSGEQFNKQPGAQFEEELSGALTHDKQRKAVLCLARQLGLVHSDTGIIRAQDDLSLLRDLAGTPRGRFIPYTSNAMNWHTDGYYSDPGSTVRSFTLHCLEQATVGGTLTLLDPELLLIKLYNEDPQLVCELTHADAMLLPANADAEGHNRPDRHVPVFFTHNDDSLGMRFTTRNTHIKWRSAGAAEAATRVTQLISQSEAWHVPVLLQPGQGIITRNVLHRRDAFTDGTTQPARQILRGRYLHLPAEPAHAACQ